MSVFKILSSEGFLNTIYDRCFFVNSLSNRKTQEIVTSLYYSQIKNIVMIEDNNLIIRQCDSPEELTALKRKEYELAYKDLNSQIEEYYENLEGEPVVSKEEMDRETRKAAIKLGYITE